MVSSCIVPPPTWVLPAAVKNVHCDALGLGRRRVDAACVTALVMAAATGDDAGWRGHEKEPYLTTTMAAARVDRLWAAAAALGLTPEYSSAPTR